MKQTIILALVLTAAGKLFALLRDVALASAFGVSVSTDAYFIAVTVPGVFWLAIHTTISSVFLPQYVAHQARTPNTTETFVVESLRLYSAIAAFIALLTILLAYPIVSVAAPGAPAATLDQAAEFTIIIALGFVLTAYVGVQNAIQQANGRFIAPLSVPVINHSITIVSILLAAYSRDIRIAVVGGVLGWVLQVPIQRWRTLDFYRTRLGWQISRRTWKRLSLLSLPVALAVLLDQLNIFIGIVLASDFGAGAISHLTYASRLTMFSASLVSWLVAYFLFPPLARNATAGNDHANGTVLAAGLAIIIAATAPIVVIALAMAEDVIALVYGRGAFRAEDITETATVFVFYGFGILFIALREMLNRVFFSYQRTFVPFLIGLGGAVINILASYVLSRTMGVAGIALGATTAAILFAGAQIGIIKGWKPLLLPTSLLRTMAAALIAAVAAYLASAALLPLLSGFGLYVRLLLGGTAALAVYGASAILLIPLFRVPVRKMLMTLKGAGR